MGQFIAGISLTCFAASYGIAWLLEAAEMMLRRGGRQLGMLAFVVLGFVAHTLYLGYRAVEYAATPLSSSFDWCLVAAWLLIVAFLYLTYYHPRTALGLYMLPLVLALVAAAKFADQTPFATDPAARAWGIVHGVSLLVGTLAMAVGFVAGLMYLSQAHRLKLKRPPLAGVRVPSLEWLEKINSRVIILSTIMVAIGFAAGIILNVVGREGVGSLPWNDPVIWSSALMLAWLLAASLFNGFYRPARRGRKVAYLTVVSFLFLVASIGVLLLVNTQHGRKEGEACSKPERLRPLAILPGARSPEPGPIPGGRS